VNALKEARKALQGERDEALARVRKEESGRKEDREGLKRDLKEMEERHRRVLADRDQVRLVIRPSLPLDTSEKRGILTSGPCPPSSRS